jgi:methionyl-tRNA synthetase
VQTDVFVRFKKLTGRPVLYVCADDTHGTPIELNALKRGITPEELVAQTWAGHVRDYAGFSIGFDIFYTTNSPENKKWAEYIYQSLREKGLIEEKEIEQFYCESCRRFLPDRFITGACPRCAAQNQYGDVCEVCGATYEPTELKTPECMICKGKPSLKKSRHLFVQLAKAKEFLQSYLNDTGVLQNDMKNFVMHWVDEGLREWCISRDGPYFGFPIPHTENKFFYVWLDAPIGYISSTEKYCSGHNLEVNDIWGRDADSEVIHFIGKDIVQFHTLFWPVMLDAAGMKLPSRVFVHGFLTVNGEKMSKSRGTFILAHDYLNKVSHHYAAEYLRFYFCSKLGGTASDIDMNIGEFRTRINTTLINNIGNLHHRTFVFVDRYFDKTIPDAAWDEGIAQTVHKTAPEIASHFNNVEYKLAIEKIHALGNLGNKYYQDSKPWELIKTDKDKAAVVMVTCVNLVKALAVFLKPVVPNLVAKIEGQFLMDFTWNDYQFSLRNRKPGETEKLFTPLEMDHFSALQAGTDLVVSPEAAVKEPDDLIDITEFRKVRLKVGLVRQAERIPGSEKLLKLSVEAGTRTHQIIAGIGKFYTPEEMAGKSIVFVANLKPASLMGLTSEGMVLAAQKGKKLVLLKPDGDIVSGASIS